MDRIKGSYIMFFAFCISFIGVYKIKDIISIEGSYWIGLIMLGLFIFGFGTAYIPKEE